MMRRISVTVGAKSNQPSALRSKSSAASVFHYSTVVFNFFMSQFALDGRQFLANLFFDISKHEFTRVVALIRSLVLICQCWWRLFYSIY